MDAKAELKKMVKILSEHCGKFYAVEVVGSDEAGWFTWLTNLTDKSGAGLSSRTEIMCFSKAKDDAIEGLLRKWSKNGRTWPPAAGSAEELKIKLAIACPAAAKSDRKDIP